MNQLARQPTTKFSRGIRLAGMPQVRTIIEAAWEGAIASGAPAAEVLATAQRQGDAVIASFSARTYKHDDVRSIPCSGFSTKRLHRQLSRNPLRDYVSSRYRSKRWIAARFFRVSRCRLLLVAPQLLLTIAVFPLLASSESGAGGGDGERSVRHVHGLRGVG